MKKFILLLLMFSFVCFSAAGCVRKPNERQKTYAEEIEELHKFYEEDKIYEKEAKERRKIYAEEQEERRKNFVEGQKERDKLYAKVYEPDKSLSERIEEIRNLPPEEKKKRIEESLAKYDCYGFFDITRPEVFCPCYTTRIHEMLTEEIKDLFLKSDILWRYKEWYESKESKKLGEYLQNISQYCKETTGGGDFTEECRKYCEDTGLCLPTECHD